MEALRGLGCTQGPLCSSGPDRRPSNSRGRAASYVVPALRAGRPCRGQGRGRPGGARGEEATERGGSASERARV